MSNKPPEKNIALYETHFYPELCVTNDHRTSIRLPDQCPICGAKRVDGNDGLYCFAWREYACGGGYTKKPQIQMYTICYWGHCCKDREPDRDLKEIKRFRTSKSGNQKAKNEDMMVGKLIVPPVAGGADYHRGASGRA